MTDEDGGEPPCTVECSFSLSGRDFDPDECRREIDVPGATVWRQRHAQFLGRRDLPMAAVYVTVGPEEFDTIEEPVHLVLDKLAPTASRIVACADRLGLKASVVCLIKVYTERPLYVLSPASIRAMAVLGAELSFDIIDLRPDAEP